MWHIKGIHSEVMGILHLDNNHVEIDVCRFQKEIGYLIYQISSCNAVLNAYIYIYRSVLYNYK